MNATVVGSSGAVTANTSTNATGGGSGLTWIRKEGTFWTTSSSTSRFQWITVIRRGIDTNPMVFDQLQTAFPAPYAGALRRLTVAQNGGTSASMNVILQKVPAAGGSPSDWVTVSNLTFDANNPSQNGQSWAQTDSTVQLAQGDTVQALLQYNGSGVNQSSTLYLDFAFPNVT